MNCKYRITLFAALMTTGFAVSAEEVFEKVDKQGGVEFSDQPSPGAKAIDVKPNVVNVTPVKPMGTTSPAPATGVAEKPADEAPEVIREGGAGYLYDEDEKRKKHKKHEKVLSEGKAVQQPARGEARKGAAGAAGAARGGASGR